MYHRENKNICNTIIERLEDYGIDVDIESGRISYREAKSAELSCNELYLLRHGETFGTSSHRFMSNNSENSCLTKRGIDSLLFMAEQIDKMELDVILHSDIPRVKKTAEVICSNMENKVKAINLSWMTGIDNAGWEGKTKAELKGTDGIDFYQREIVHNVFAKSSGGSSWGMVFVRCAELIEYLNENHRNENVLLISQGSIRIGLEILLYRYQLPWEQYNSERFFGLKEKEEGNYGELCTLYERKQNGLMEGNRL